MPSAGRPQCRSPSSYLGNHLFCLHLLFIQIFNNVTQVTSFSPYYVQQYWALRTTTCVSQTKLFNKLTSFDELHRTKWYHQNDYFWGKSRSEDEILDYCAKNIFFNEDVVGARKRIKVLSAELPLIVIDDFLSDEMCEAIIQAAKESAKIVRSTLGANQDVSKIRTSSTTWLPEKGCKIPLQILSTKISRLSGIPKENSENLQVVRYENGEKFDVHTDHLHSFNKMGCRGRLATCLLYLNSAQDDFTDEEGFFGGSTYFPEYDAEVKPKRGTAVFWFNTVERPGSSNFNEDMFLHVDLKSRHCGKPIVGQEKWVCNSWLHPVAMNEII